MRLWLLLGSAGGNQGEERSEERRKREEKVKTAPRTP